jgi:hypothetical protein
VICEQREQIGRGGITTPGNLFAAPAFIQRQTRKQERPMDTTTLVVLIIILFLLFGGGWYGRGRWY